MAQTNKSKQAQAGRLKTATLGTIGEPLKIAHSYPSERSEFIAELSGLITKWGGRPGKDAIDYAAVYENVLCQLLTPEPTEQ